jgi:Complex I intermediate-associated protein 30 (CIA30)
MGGQSESTAERKDDCLVWEGEVKLVEFLQSPGFCILQNKPTDSLIPPLSKTNGISFFVHPHTEFMTMTATVQTDSKLYGFHVQYEAALETVGIGENGWLELHASWTSFRPTLMGEDVEAPKLEQGELDKVQVVVSFATEGGSVASMKFRKRWELILLVGMNSLPVGIEYLPEPQSRKISSRVGQNCSHYRKRCRARAMAE